MNLTALIDDDGQLFDMNALAHETVFTELLRLGTVTEHYPLWTDAPDADWLQVHAAEHRAWSNALLLSLPPDLDSVDFRDRLSVDVWKLNHYQHHVLVAGALGL